MRPTVRTSGAIAAIFALTLANFAAGERDDRSRESQDRLAAEIERWSAFVASHTAADENWAQIKQSSQPMLARALAAFEAEWARMQGVLRDDLAGTPAPSAFDGVRPAAVRALGEAALAQVRVYYEASLEYGRNTMPDSGLFYLGAAQAQREFAAFCRTLSEPSARRAPPLRALAPELDALQAEVLAAYRPPASIDKHGEFIAASSMLKEARELDAAGLRYGALLRYLQATLRFAPLRPAPLGPDRVPPEAPMLAKRLSEYDARLSTGRLDHSLGRLFLEMAQDDASDAATRANPTLATAIAGDVLPRYFAALEPARPAAPRPAPKVAVTLVRWPYT